MAARVMRTPSLRRRVTVAGMTVFVVLVVLLDLFVLLSLQARFDDTLDEVLASRVELVRELDERYDGAELAERLGTRAVPAIITTPQGERLETGAIPRFDVSAPAPPTDEPARISTVIGLQDGGTAEVFVSRGGADDALRRARWVTLLGTGIAVLAALLLFRRAAAVAIAPLEQVVATARRTAAGHSGERLTPDDPHTELGRFATTYDAMLDALEDALDTTRQGEERTRRFLDDAAHQLRTPLASVRASAEALLREEDAQVRDQLLANLVREVARADRLVSALLTLARLDGTGAAAATPTDVAAVCRDEVARCQSLAPHLDVELTVDDDARPALTDPEGLRETVANLLDNARRHASRHIGVEVRGDPATCTVRVGDDGPGLTARDADRVFQRFATLDGRGGSGLGLAIGRARAERDGGTLRWEVDGFVLRIPAAPGAEAAADPQI